MGTSDGNEPAGFGWRVKSGSDFAPGGPIVIHQGFGNAFQGIHLDAPAYDGQQWLDLVGGGSGATPARPSRKSCPPPPAGSMFLPSPMRTTPSRPPRRAECLPQIPIRFPPPLASRTPRGTDLIPPLTITHETATVTDYHWTTSGPVNFTAQSSSTSLQFKANYLPRSFTGLFLDGISVKPVSTNK